MCNKCGNNNCGCSQISHSICNECNETPCTGCAVKDLSTSCILYDGDDLPCTEIKGNQPLTDILQQFDAYFCTIREEFLNLLTFVNTGIGSRVFKGIDILGRKQFRKINNGESTLTQVAENEDDISVTIDEEALTEFIQDNVEIVNVGTGAEVFKQFNTTTDEYEFKSVIVDDQDGMGESFIRDVQENTDDITVRVKKAKSSTLSITSDDENIFFDIAETTQIPALYVNNLYEPSYEDWLEGGGDLITNPSFLYRGEGTLVKPFTDSRNYTSTVAFTDTANTAIQNALDGHPTLSYVGSGTRLLPQRSGEKIIVQNNNSFYSFSGDFSYSSLDIELQENVVCSTTDWLVDMDNILYFDSTSSIFKITISEDSTLQFVDSLGFRNSGNTSSTPPAFDTGRIGFLLGDGILHSSYNGVDVLTRYIFNGDGNINDGNLHFQIKCKLKADYQGIYLSKNKNAIDFYNLAQSGQFSGSVNTSLQAFRMTGGQIRFYDKGSIYIGSETSGRDYGLTFEPEDDGVGYCTFQLNSAQVTGNSNYCFAKLNDENVNFLAFNSSSGDGFSTTLPGINTIVNGLFENLGVTPWQINFKNNVFSSTGIDFTKVDLTGGNTYSAINFIGDNVIETLTIYDNRASAILAGIPLYSAYLKTSGVAYPSTAGWVRDIVLPA